MRRWAEGELSARGDPQNTTPAYGAELSTASFLSRTIAMLNTSDFKIALDKLSYNDNNVWVYSTAFAAYVKFFNS